MSSPKKEVTTATLIGGEHVAIPDGDYREVAIEVVEQVIDHLHCVIDKLREFLDERDEAAPISVMRAQVLLASIDHEKREWLKAARC